MEGWKFVMDVAIATLIAVFLSAVLSFIFNTWVDNRGWKKVEEKIGDTSKGALNVQHEDIKDTVKAKTDSIEKVIIDKTSSIYTKVDKINDITIKNETLYETLNIDQKEVKNNVNKLILDWEKTVSENKELKLINKKILEEMDLLKESRLEAKIENKDIREKLDKLNSVNRIISEEKQELKNKNIKLEEENNNLYSKINELNNSDEDEWDMEM